MWPYKGGYIDNFGVLFSSYNWNETRQYKISINIYLKNEYADDAEDDEDDVSSSSCDESSEYSEDDDEIKEEIDP